MIPRDISCLYPPYTIPPEYILCYNRNRSSFNHTAVLLSFYVGLLLMPSSLVCYRLISSFLVITRFNPPDIVFSFRFGEISADWQIIRNAIYSTCWGKSIFAFSEISLFLLKEWGFFFFQSSIFSFIPDFENSTLNCCSENCFMNVSSTTFIFKS